MAALEAMLEVQVALAGGVQPLRLKVGIHEGRCLAVTLNDRLDYFGSTVNAAARIVGLSTGEDVVVSGAVRDDPEVAARLLGVSYKTLLQKIRDCGLAPE